VVAGTGMTTTNYFGKNIFVAVAGPKAKLRTEWSCEKKWLAGRLKK